MSDIKRWKGLKALVQDAVENGASAIERVHLETAKRPFAALKMVPPIEKPVEGIQTLHDTIVSGVYGTVRVVTRAVGKGLDAALDALEDESEKPATSSDASPAGEEPPRS
jgi:hypothetical protein